MRIKNMAVLAIALFGSAPVWGQTAMDAPSPAPAVASGATPLAEMISIDVATAGPATPEITAPAAPAIPGIPGPLDYPTLGESDKPVPSNSVPQSYWFRADYLLWFMHYDKVPPLIAAIPAGEAISGNIKEANTLGLFPSKDGLLYGGLSGLRIDTGMWIDTANHIGIDIGGFDTTQSSKSAFFASNALGLPALARFYTNANNSVPTFLLFSSPGTDPASTYSGTVSANSNVSSVYSGEINAR